MIIGIYCILLTTYCNRLEGAMNVKSTVYKVLKMEKNREVT